MKPRYTFWLKLLAFSLAFLAISNGMRVWSAFHFAAWIRHFDAAVSPLYIGLSGGFASLGALAGCYGLWRQRSWGLIYVRVFVLVYAAWYWFDRLVLAQSEASAANRLFALLFTLYCILYTFLAVGNARTAGRGG